LLRAGVHGYVIADPHDHGQLAKCLGDMLDNGRRHAFAVAARLAATQWTFEQHYRVLLHVFDEAVLRKRAA